MGATMNETDRLVLFVLNEQKYALPLPVVERVLRAVEVTALPDAPAIIMGVINVSGDIVPVIDLRRRFHLDERSVDVDDHFIVAVSSTMRVALPVDETVGMVREAEGERIAADEIVPDLNYVAAVVPQGDDMVFLLDIDTVLTPDEEAALSDSLTGAPQDGD